MMTEKLYDIDSYIWEFEATVLSCEEREGGYAVVLDRTAFFPEGGGQGADLGTLELVNEREGAGEESGASFGSGPSTNFESGTNVDGESSTNFESGTIVLDVKEKDGVIYHFVDKPLAVGAKIVGKLDTGRRFRHMQNHSGEHIISGIVHNMYGYENVGFHLGSSDTTLDFDGELTAEQIDEIEWLANEAVAKNLKFICSYPEKEALDSMEYRSKLELSGEVRIVEIEGLDRCACCAPHVKVSGEIGLIRITEFMRYKGGMRLHILCGFDALLGYRHESAELRAISNLLSLKRGEIAVGVEKLFTDLHASRAEAAALRRSLVAAELKNAELSGAVSEDGKLLFFVDGFSPDELRGLINGGLLLTDKLCAAFSGNDADGYKYIIGSKQLPLRSMAKEINAALGGKGGGSDLMIQGSYAAKREEIEAYFDTLKI